MAIIKILSRHSPSYGSLINYILQNGKNSKPEIITNNLRSNTIDGYIKEFLENESFRKVSRSDQVFLFHEILSFNAREDSQGITPELMHDIVREYIRLRGNDKVVVGAVHRDKEHIHAHLCVSALNFRTGKSARLSKSELFQLKTNFQEYHKEKYPFLSQSEPDHGANKLYPRHEKWHIMKREQRAVLKEQLSSEIKNTLLTAKTQNEFLDILRDKGYYHYERNGRVVGIEIGGDKFRFSRLMELEQFEELSKDMAEEERILDEIQSIREARQMTDRDIEGLER